MADKPFDPTKPVQTRDGRSARIICTDRNHHKYTIVALVTNSEEEEEETAWFFTKEGVYYGDGYESFNDLVNVPVRTSKWQNVYKASVYPNSRYFSKEEAIRKKAPDCDPCGMLEYVFEDDELIEVIFHKEV